MEWLPQLFPSHSAVSDEEAMRDVQVRGDHQAFTHLVHRWETPIRRLCIRMTGDEHRGEDLAQEAFASVFANRKQFDLTRKFSTWLWRIALNLCYQEARRALRRGEFPVEADAENASVPRCAAELAPATRLMEEERAALVRMALASLPETYRVVVILREYEGLKCREIAEVLNIPEGTVKWRIAQALTQLSQRLKLLFPDEAKRLAGAPAKTAKER